MNYKVIFNTIGRVAVAEAFLLLLPTAVSLIYGESCYLAFLLTAVFSFLIGFLLLLCFRPKNHVIYAKEGFAIVTLVWLGMSAIGAVPFVLCGDIPSYVDAFFETVSGFTTTGASIIRDVEVLNHGTLFWRSFSHWVGGMGVLVFVMAIIPNVSDRSIHIMRAEMPGPVVGKIVPRVKDTAKILYLIYIALTALEIAMLCCGGMPVFDSLVHSFGTAGTGGFGIKSDSIASYSPYLQWVIAIFMLLFGVNFNLYYLLLIKRFRSVFRSTELWVYIGIAFASSAIITLNVFPMYKNSSVAIRQSVFQVSSILTTTGYATADFNKWNSLSKGIIFVLMFSGGCAGSTAGGLKISRTIMMFKMIGREFKRMLHPRTVSTVRFEGKTVEEQTLQGVTVYFAVYMLCILATFLLICYEPFGMETNFTATVSCFNNVGPGLAGVGPASSYADYSVLSKLVLSFAMLLGRLEIFPLLIALSPSTWTKK